MTDKNTAALAVDHTEHHLEMAGRWYMVNRDGMATLCADREDAEKEAADAQSVWPHMGPHRAVQHRQRAHHQQRRPQRVRALHRRVVRQTVRRKKNDPYETDSAARALCYADFY